MSLPTDERRARRTAPAAIVSAIVSAIVALAAAAALLPHPTRAQEGHEHEHGDETPAGEPVEKPVVFLDKSPRIVAFQLARLSNAQLLLVDRGVDHPKYRPVWEAILLRPGIDAALRAQCVAAIARLDETGSVQALIGGIGKAAADEKLGAVLHELSLLLLAADAEALRAALADLEALSAEGESAAARAIAWAARARLADAAALWALASEAATGRADLLDALWRIEDLAFIDALHDEAAALAGEAGDEDTRRAAIRALPRFAGHEAESFAMLSRLYRDDVERATVVRGILRLPPESWPAAEVPPLAEALLATVRETPASERTEGVALDALDLGNALAARVPGDEGKALRKALRELGVQVLVLRTVPHQMLYDKMRLVVEAGKAVEIVLENPDLMPHNLVITAPGAREEIGEAAEKMPPVPDAEGRLYIPDSDKILHATRILDPGEKTRLAFTAPETPARYPYVCTFPGHWRRMYGVLIVVADLEEYLANPPPEDDLPPMTEWKLDDLAADLVNASPARAAAGKTIFVEATCAQCHKRGEIGNTLGPPLDETLAKWKGARADVLREILEPSRTIEEKYANWLFVSSQGQIVSGIIVGEADGMLTVQSGPTPDSAKSIARADIVTQQRQDVSFMPLGLLSLLSREQILDLLSFIEYGEMPAGGGGGD